MILSVVFFVEKSQLIVVIMEEQLETVNRI